MLYITLQMIPFLLVILTSLTVVNGNSISIEQFPALNYLLVIFLVLHSGLFAGLTLGLLGLDKIGLEIVMGGDNKELAEYARIIYPIRSNGNFLLCTLLLGNVATNSLLSIILADISSGVVGFVSSTALIVLFGEVIPQSVCSRHALWIGSRSINVLKFYMFLFYPFSKPLSMVLNWVLGEEIGTIHTRVELRKMLELHVKHGTLDIESGNVMDGALKYRDMTVKEVMTVASKVYMLSISEKLNFKVLSEIFKSGFSRIPVYDKDRNDIVGLLLAKDLLFIDPEDEVPVSSFINLFGRGLQVVWPDQKLGEVLKIFKKGRGHLAVVRDVNSTGTSDPFYEVQGIITLEDIIEEILGEEIVDETDMNIDGLGRSQHNRDMDIARLRLLNPKLFDEKLSSEEAKAIAAHLFTNVPQLKILLDGLRGKTVNGQGQSDGQRQGQEECSVEEVGRILLRCPVLHLHGQYRSSHAAIPEDALYRRGKPTQACIVVLSGKLEVRAGKDEFRSEMGPFSVLGADALLQSEKDGSGYIPDFTAYPASDTEVRCVRISRSTCVSVTESGGGNSSSNGSSSVPVEDIKAQRRSPLKKGGIPKGSGSSGGAAIRNQVAAQNIAPITDSEQEEVKYSFDSTVVTATSSSTSPVAAVVNESRGNEREGTAANQTSSRLLTYPDGRGTEMAEGDSVYSPLADYGHGQGYGHGRR